MHNDVYKIYIQLFVILKNLQTIILNIKYEYIFLIPKLCAPSFMNVLLIMMACFINIISLYHHVKLYMLYKIQFY